MPDRLNNVSEFNLFRADATGGVSEADTHLAAAILMFEVVKVDGRIARAEMNEVIANLRKRFSLSGEEIGRLLEVVGETGNLQLDLEAFALQLRENWDQEKRLRLLTDFWIIAVADEVIDARERQLIERIAVLLNLNEEEIDRARHQAKHWLEFKTT